MLKAMLDTAFANQEDFAKPFTTARSRSRSPTQASSRSLIAEVIAANPRQVEQFKGGKRTVAAFFVGQVMKASKGQANPAVLNELVDEETGRGLGA